MCVDTDDDGNPDALFFYASDANNNVTHLVDESGALAEIYSYDLFENPRVHDPSTFLELPGSQVGNPYLFTGRRWEPEVGLYYYRARFFDPKDGEFISRDPIGAWGDPANLGNGMAYAGNNPWNGRDPSGLKGLDAWAVIKWFGGRALSTAAWVPRLFFTFQGPGPSHRYCGRCKSDVTEGLGQIPHDQVCSTEQDKLIHQEELKLELWWKNTGRHINWDGSVDPISNPDQFPSKPKEPEFFCGFATQGDFNPSGGSVDPLDRIWSSIKRTGGYSADPLDDPKFVDQYMSAGSGRSVDPLDSVLRSLERTAGYSADPLDHSWPRGLRPDQGKKRK